MKKELLLGAHMSIAGGIENAIIKGQEIGCTAIQIFTKSNRQWAAKPLTQKEITLFKETWKTSSIHAIVAHGSYLINIGSPKKDIAHKSAQALIKEMNRCNALGITYLTLHPGAHLNEDKETCLRQIAQSLDYAFEQTDHAVCITLETMAGQGTTVCDTFQDIAFIIKHTKHKKRIAVTLDTCHIFAAGYDITTKNKYDHVMKEFDTIIGLDHLKIIHLNDSKRPLDSHVDRHEEIGDGKIGLEGFKFLMNDPRFFATPKILETPEIAKYKKNIELLKSLVSVKNRKILGLK